MLDRNPSRLPMTRALCTALAAGASLEQALLIAKEVSPHYAGRLENAAREVENDAFRKDVLQHLELDPPIAGAVLGRARREQLAHVAEIAVGAMRGEEPRALNDAPLSDIYLVFASAIAVLVALWVWRSAMPIDPRAMLAGAIAAFGALAAAIATLLRKWPVGSRFELLMVLIFPPLLFFDTARIIERTQRPLLDTKRVLAWMAAGEVAGLVPGAVIAALLLDVRSVREHRLLRKLESKLRGSGDARKAAETWMATSAMPQAMVKVAQHPLPGDSNADATLRLARIVGLLPQRFRVEAFLPYLALLLLVVAATAIGAGVLIAIANIGGIE